MPEFSMQNLRGDGVGQPSVVLGIGLANIVFDSLNFNANTVPSVPLPEAAKFPREPIDHILRWGSYAYILVSIIKTISVDMVAMFSAFFGKAKYLAVHQYAVNPSVNSRIAYRIPLIAGFIFPAVGMKRCPFELGKIRVAVRGHDSALALRKRDFTVGCIRGCHSLSYQRLGFGGTTNPDTLILPEAEPRYAMEGQS